MLFRGDVGLGDLTNSELLFLVYSSGGGRWILLKQANRFGHLRSLNRYTFLPSKKHVYLPCPRNLNGDHSYYTTVVWVKPLQKPSSSNGNVAAASSVGRYILSKIRESVGFTF